MKIDPGTVEQARFTAQYMFVADYCAKYVDSYGYSVPVQLQPERFVTISNDHSVESYYLLLKSVKNTTREDFLEFMSKSAPGKDIGLIKKAADVFERRDMNIYGFLVERMFSEPISGDSVNFKLTDLLAGVDFLRSKGYLVPWNAYTIDLIVAKGWVKLI